MKKSTKIRKSSKPFSKLESSFLDKLLQKLRANGVKKYIKKKSIVCDFGCGYEGIVLHNIKELISLGIGLDLWVNPKYSDSIIKLKKANLNRRLSIKSNYFDTVISLATIEHLDKAEKAISEIYRILKPGGLLIMTVPSIFSKPVLEFLAYRLHLINEQSIREHKRYFDKKSLMLLCKSAGFKTIKHNYFQFFMNNFVYAEK